MIRNQNKKKGIKSIQRRIKKGQLNLQKELKVLINGISSSITLTVAQQQQQNRQRATWLRAKEETLAFKKKLAEKSKR